MEKMENTENMDDPNTPEPATRGEAKSYNHACFGWQPCDATPLSNL